MYATICPHVNICSIFGYTHSNILHICRSKNCQEWWIKFTTKDRWDFSDDSVGKESACNAGDSGSIFRSEISPGKGNGNPPCILAWRIPWTQEPDRGIVHRVTKSWTLLNN